MATPAEVQQVIQRQTEMIDALLQHRTPKQSNISSDLLAGIPDFYGDDQKDKFYAKEWLTCLETAGKVGDWKFDHVKIAIFAKFKEEAFNWHLRYGSACQNYDQWKALFKESVFIKRRDVSLLHRELFTIIQRRDESFREYARRKEKICFELDKGVSETKNEILLSLNSHCSLLSQIM